MEEEREEQEVPDLSLVSFAKSHVMIISLENSFDNQNLQTGMSVPLV